MSLPYLSQASLGNTQQALWLKTLSNAEKGLFNVISIEFPIIFYPETPPSSGDPDCVDSKYSLAPTTLSWNSS